MNIYNEDMVNVVVDVEMHISTIADHPTVVLTMQDSDEATVLRIPHQRKQRVKTVALITILRKH